MKKSKDLEYSFCIGLLIFLAAAMVVTLIISFVA